MTTTSAPDPRDGNLDALRATLRGLRLPGIAEDLPAILEEAQKGGWGQIDLLWELFRREEVRKGQRRFERNFKASGLTRCYGLEHFDFDLGRAHGLEPSVVRDLAQCEFVAARRNIVLAGGVETLSRTTFSGWTKSSAGIPASASCIKAVQIGTATREPVSSFPRLRGRS